MKMKSKLRILSAILAMGISSSVLATVSKMGNTAFLADVPGIGLVVDEIKFDGIKINNFHFENDKKFIFVKPEQKLYAHFNYEVDASKLKAMHLKHLIIGLHDDGPQKCVLDTLGINDTNGKAKISLIAPEKPGVYQVRFSFSERLTKSQAMKDWWKGEGPSAKTIVGIVVTK